MGLAGPPEDGKGAAGATSDAGGLGSDPGECPPEDCEGAWFNGATSDVGCLGAGVSMPKGGGASQECCSTSAVPGLRAGNV